MKRQSSRSLKRLAVAVISIASSLALVGGIGGPPSAQAARAASYPVQPVAAIAELPSTIGIAEGHEFYDMSEDEIADTLDAMQALGVQNVRVGIFWAFIEDEQGVYDWTNLDRMVSAAEARGMGVLGTILYTPIREEGDAWSDHPDPTEYGVFTGAIAERYAGRISAYEIWNEPTASMFWDPVDPAAYTAILQASYTAIKDADPSAVVVAGSLTAGPTYEDGTAMSPVEFLAGMYEAGAKGYFDALSYHPYQYTMPFSEGQDLPVFDYPIEQYDMIRALMVEHGDGGLKVWISEYGQPTNVTYQNVYLTEQMQADFIENLLRTWQTIDGAGPVFVYQTRDTAPDGTEPEQHLGLYDYEWNAKLAAGVLADLIKEFNPPPTAANPLQAFLQQVARAIGQALAFIPRLVTQVVQAVVNFVGSVLGINRPNTTLAVSGPEPEVTEADSAAVGARSMAYSAPGNSGRDGAPETSPQQQSFDEPKQAPAGERSTAGPARQDDEDGSGQKKDADENAVDEEQSLGEDADLDPAEPVTTGTPEDLSPAADLKDSAELKDEDADSSAVNSTSPAVNKPDNETAAGDRDIKGTKDDDNDDKGTGDGS